MAGRTDDLRRQQAECERLAETASDPMIHREFRQMAARFAHLADRIERGNLQKLIAAAAHHGNKPAAPPAPEAEPEPPTGLRRIPPKDDAGA